MTTIQLTTHYFASIDSVFNVNRDIGLHELSAKNSNEVAIAGITTGLINKGDTVTWKGKHFGVYLTHQSLISEMRWPTYFVDEQLKGNFKSFKHQHFFVQEDNYVAVTDLLAYETPFGFLGKLFDKFLLKRYLTQFIKQRNAFLKQLAENS